MSELMNFETITMEKEFMEAKNNEIAEKMKALESSIMAIEKEFGKGSALH